MNKINSNIFYGAIYDANGFEYEYAPSHRLCWGDTQSISM